MPPLSITKAGPLCNFLLAIAGTAPLALIPNVPAKEVWREVSPHDAPTVPEPAREFRGVWVATVYNLDWPSKPGLPVETQKQELLDILDGAATQHLNAVVLQVRTMCDAFYASPLEPWSYYLTGELGKAPEPFWDPLAFAVAEAHARGIELHAWFNPFRAVTTEYGPRMPDSHISKQYPWLIKTSGRTQWLDPSSDFVRSRAIATILDVVNRYDIDAVHLDDYFYPYPGRSGEPGLDDAENWVDYHLGQGGSLERDEWRRELVNGLIKDLYREIKRAKPWVKLGISPFGIWRSGEPDGIKGMDAYSQIFADSRKWLREGWVDYLAPQLYWKMKGPQSFETLHRWWQDENVKGRHLWPGIATSRIGSGGEGDRRDAAEIMAQITTTRDYPGKSASAGQLHWHWEAFATDRGGVRKRLSTETYAQRALPPASPWLAGLEMESEDQLPSAAGLTIRDGSHFDWLVTDGNRTVRWWLIQTRQQEKTAIVDATTKSKGKTKTKTKPQAPAKAPAWTWTTAPLIPGDRVSARLDDLATADTIAIRAVDAYGQLGPVAVWQRRSPTAMQKTIDEPTVAATE
jgi:uncharacterized lipoprotein YddW (UPF0748 family)